MSLYNPAGLLDLSFEVMALSHRDPVATRVRFAAMQSLVRALMVDTRRRSDAAAATTQYRVAIGHETVVLMVLRSFPCLPDATDEIQASYRRVAQWFAALGQVRAAEWARALAEGRPMRFRSHPSCQLAVLPGLYEAFLPAGHGWFVEVGAYDCATFSNTAGLVEQGWNGLYVEPQSYYLELGRQRYGYNPGVHFEHCAVGRDAGEGTISDAGVMSRVSVGAPALDASGAPIAIVRLDALLQKHGVPPGFELLVIDVEGDEAAVLDSFDLAHWRPRLLIVELGDLDPATAPPSDPRLQAHRTLVTHGYGIVYQDDVNTAYLRDAADTVAGVSRP